jgi:hypothetical protein
VCSDLQVAEQLQQLIATNFAAKHGSAVLIDAMNLEDVLHDIQTDGANLHGDRSSAAGGPIDSTTLAHRDAVRPGAVHPIKLPNWGSLIMQGYELTDFEWGKIAPLLPNKPRGGAAGR